MLTPDFLFSQEANIAPYEGGGGMSGDRWGQPFAVKCRVQHVRKRVIRQIGTASGAVQEVIGNALGFFPAGTRMPAESKVTVDGIEYRVLQVSPIRALSESHVEVVLL